MVKCRELYEKEITKDGSSVTVTLYDDGSLLIINDNWRDDNVETLTFEGTKELAKILNAMVKDIENRKLRELAKNEHNR